MDRDLYKIYLYCVNFGYDISYYELNRSGLKIKFGRAWEPIIVRFYDKISAICQKCYKSFEVEVARNLVKQPRNSFGVCEDCEIKEFIEKDY